MVSRIATAASHHEGGQQGQAEERPEEVDGPLPGPDGESSRSRTHRSTSSRRHSGSASPAGGAVVYSGPRPLVKPGGARTRPGVRSSNANPPQSDRTRRRPHFRSVGPVGDGPADGRGQRGVLALDGPPEDLVELEVVDPVVLAEVHLVRPLGAVGERRCSRRRGRSGPARRRRGSRSALSVNEANIGRGGGVELAQRRQAEDQLDRPDHAHGAVLGAVEVLAAWCRG